MLVVVDLLCCTIECFCRWISGEIHAVGTCTHVRLHCRLPLVLPSDVVSQLGRSGGDTSAGGRLEVAAEGAAFLASLGSSCIAPVVLIGPYRSGKSFTLNQLLQVDCGE
jgi:hypothetical protein